jgi:hypothetical protein
LCFKLETIDLGVDSPIQLNSVAPLRFEPIAPTIVEFSRKRVSLYLHEHQTSHARSHCGQ